MRYQNYLILYIRIIQFDLFFCWKDSYKHFFLKCHNIFSTELNISATMKSKIVKVNGKRRWMHLILWRICCYHLEVIDHLFALRNCFYFLFAIIFSSQLTVISVNAKVYFAQCQQKFAIHKRLFLKFRDFFFPAKIPARESFYPYSNKGMSHIPKNWRKLLKLKKKIFISPERFSKFQQTFR